MKTYSDFLGSKVHAAHSSGLSEMPKLPDSMFDHQRVLTEWALRKGRAAIFADTGLGKSRMQLAWADAVHRVAAVDVLILAPLAVAAQTVSEGASIGIDVNLCKSGEDVRQGITIANYERLHRFDCTRFGGVVLDESSCIKHHNTKTLQVLLDSFRETQWKLCATATPAPNDWTELGTHAEFLGVCSRAEMLAEFFVHDGGETQVWRLKGHARKQFWKWVSGWGALVRKPSDLGFDDSAYVLPPLETFEHVVDSDAIAAEGMLFALEASSLSERRDARKASLNARVAACAAQISAEPDQPWIIWCELNAEADALRAAVPASVEIRGPDDLEDKERRLREFSAGSIKDLITKTSIAGWGLNWQHCRRMAFVGVTDSFESYYQAVRRCYRFGQKHPVHVHLFISPMEGPVLANLKRKEADAKAMSESLSKETNEAVSMAVLGQARQTNDYQPKKAIKAPSWLKDAA